MYKPDLEWKNLQWLIYYKTLQNQSVFLSAHTFPLSTGAVEYADYTSADG